MMNRILGRRRRGSRLRPLGFALALLLGGAGQVKAEQGIVVVANTQVTASQASRAQLRSVFGMRTRTWPDGESVRVFVLKDTHPVHERFTKTILKTFPYNLRKIWDTRVFSGTGQYPTVVNDETEMYRRVSETDSAIGYLSTPHLGEGVKVLELQE